MSRQLTVSFGQKHPAQVTAVKQLTWEEFAGWLIRRPGPCTEKSENGWYCPVEFLPAYRDSSNFVARHCLTFDFDHVPLEAAVHIEKELADTEFALYTTFSHTPEKPRFRVVMPLSRPCSYDEFQAVSRHVAGRVGIELVARESHVPSQMMYAPAVKDGAPHIGRINQGEWLNVDLILDDYLDWTDRKSWPHRADGDGVHSASEGMALSTEKPGIIGAFCRAFTVPEAIARFDLPYTSTATPDRWTYTAGSRPEGAIVYDGGLRLHSHHDTDPARGQHNAFDLVRLHRFGSQDTADSKTQAITEQPSYKAMVEFAKALPELRDQAIESLPVVPEPEAPADGPPPKEASAPAAPTMAYPVLDAGDFATAAAPEWIIKGVLPRAELVVIYGESGSGKSFLTLDMVAAITRGVDWRGIKTRQGRCVYICAEGAGGFRLRMRAYEKHFECGWADLPGVIADAPNMLEPEDAALLAKQTLLWADRHREEGETGRAADVIVIDTLSATTPGANENAGEDMGTVIKHCKWLHKKTGATIVLIHHSGKDSAKGARGWSGLRAAADAEIEVVRDGDARAFKLTKQKDGADGGRFEFRLKPVVLFTDEDDEDVTSQIVEHIEESATPKAVKPAAKRKPTGKLEPVVLETLKLMAAGGSVDKVDLLDGAMIKLAKDEDGRDRRRRNAQRGLEGLIAKQLAFMHEGDRVSLTPIVDAGDEEWLKL